MGVVSDAFPLLREVRGVIVVARIEKTTRDAAEHLREQLGRLPNLIYTGSMAIRIALFAIPAMVAVGLVFVLDLLHAAPGIVAVSLGLVAVLGGASMGYFADRLPDLSVARRRRARRAGRLAGVRHGRP